MLTLTINEHSVILDGILEWRKRALGLSKNYGIERNVLVISFYSKSLLFCQVQPKKKKIEGSP